MPKKGSYVKEQFLPTSLWKRVIAFLIDSIVISLVITYPFQGLLDIGAESISGSFRMLMSNITPTSQLMMVLLASAVLVLAYWSVLESRFSQSIGKMVMKIKVRSTKGNLTFRQALMRNVSKISTLLLVLDCLFMIFTKRHQRYMEKVSETEVVEGIYGF